MATEGFGEKFMLSFGLKCLTCVKNVLGLPKKFAITRAAFLGNPKAFLRG